MRFVDDEARAETGTAGAQGLRASSIASRVRDAPPPQAVPQDRFPDGLSLSRRSATLMNSRTERTSLRWPLWQLVVAVDDVEGVAPLRLAVRRGRRPRRRRMWGRSCRTTPRRWTRAGGPPGRRHARTLQVRRKVMGRVHAAPVVGIKRCRVDHGSTIYIIAREKNRSPAPLYRLCVARVCTTVAAMSAMMGWTFSSRSVCVG